MTEQLRIRAFHKRDAMAVHRLDLTFPDPQSWASMRCYPVNQRRYVLVNERGSIRGYIFVENSGKHGIGTYVANLAVARQTQGTGWGQRLMDQAVACARRWGHQDVSLHVNATNDQGIRFYRRYGFYRAKTIKDYYDDGIAAWKMVKKV